MTLLASTLLLFSLCLCAGTAGQTQFHDLMSNLVSGWMGVRIRYMYRDIEGAKVAQTADLATATVDILVH